MPSDVRDLVSTMLERVDPRIENFFRSQPTIAQKILPADDAIQVSRRLGRLPFKQFQGGAYGKYVANEGTLGKGTMLLTNVFTFGYFYSKYAFRLSDEAVDTTQNTKQAVLNVLADTVQNAMKQVGIMDEILLFTDGTGKLTPASASSATTSDLTFTNTKDIDKLIEGMCVDCWDTTGATKRVNTTSPNPIKAIDRSAKKVTFTNAITGLVGTDLIAMQDMDAYGPSTLGSFSSTWPQTGLLGGLGGDTFRHGLYYANDATAANYFLGLQKSAVPQITAERINASSGLLSFSHGLLLKQRVRQRRDAGVIKGWRGVTHEAQRHQVWLIGQAIAVKLLSENKFGKMVDLGPQDDDADDVFYFCDIPMYVCPYADRARVDIFNPKMWSRCQLFPAQFKKNGNQLWFEGRGSDGTVQSFRECFVVQAYDFVCRDPGGAGFIDTLALPAGTEV